MNTSNSSTPSDSLKERVKAQVQVPVSPPKPQTGMTVPPISLDQMVKIRPTGEL